MEQKIQEILENHKNGKIDKYEYIAQISEYNSLLFNFSKRLYGTGINAIEIVHEGVIFETRPFGLRFLVDCSRRSAPLEILNFSEYEPFESELITKIVTNDSVVFDIGAHIGWYSLNCAKRSPNSVIYAFEPIPQTFKILSSNVERNALKNVRVFNFGFLDSNQEGKFIYSEQYSPRASLANLLDDCSNNPVIESVSCPLRKLDDVAKQLQIQRLDFLKCDAEGAELAIFQGGLETIQQFLPIIFAELYEPWCRKFGYDPDSVIDLLSPYGYGCYLVGNGTVQEIHHIVKDEENYNFYFLHKDKHSAIIKGTY